MPVYRYLKEVDLPTYDMNHFLPLVNKGAVTRFFSYPTQAQIADIGKACGATDIKVYNYDFQVHTRTDALINGKFDITLPTDEKTKSYFILKKNGTYEKLIPHSTMTGWNVATVVVADHGNAPFSVNVDPAGRPIVGDGSNRTVPKALPAKDDLIGVRIVEVVKGGILSLFKDGKLPAGAIETANGIKYTNMFNRRGVILSESMLDGWRIAAITPQSGNHWRANIVNGQVVITFSGNAFDQKVTVKLEKIGSNLTEELEIEFSGEWDILEQAGCNAGAMALLLFMLFPLFIRRKD
jgi:hypothetical protein